MAVELLQFCFAVAIDQISGKGRIHSFLPAELEATRSHRFRSFAGPDSLP